MQATTAPTPSIANSTSPTKPLVRKAASAGVYYVGSKSRPGLVHMVNVRYLHCTCAAGKRRLRCWHLTYCVGLDGWRAAQAAKAAASARASTLATHQTCVG